MTAHGSLPVGGVAGGLPAVAGSIGDGVVLALGVPAALMSVSGELLCVNGAFERLLGRSASVLLERGLPSLLDSSDGERLTSWLSRRGWRGGPGVFTCRLRSPSGSMATARLGVGPLSDGDGRSGLVVTPVVIEDLVSELRESRGTGRRYRDLADAASVLLWTTNASGRGESFNAAWRSFSGMTTGELRGYGWTECVSLSERALMTRRVREAVRGRDSFSCEVSMRRASDGAERTMLCLASARLDERGVFGGLSLVATDLTERRELEDRLREAQRAEAVGIITSGLAHDLGNMLSAMAVSVELAGRSAEPGGATSVHLSAVREAVGMARDLAGALSTLGRRGGVEHRALELRGLMESALSGLPALLPGGVSLRAEVEGERVWVLGDATQLRQSLVNLVRNAGEAMAESGGEVSVRLVCEGDWAELCVSDTGPGVPAEMRERIFTPFFTTKRRSQGTGLGLAMCRAVAEGHGGSLRVEGNDPRGTRFVLRVGVVPGPTEDEGCVEGEVPGAAWLVYRGVPERAFVAGLLEGLGVSVTITDGLVSSAPSGVVVVLDEGLLDTSSSEAGASVSGLVSGAPVVVARGSSVGEGSLWDRSVVLARPFTRADLRAAMVRAVEGAARRGVWTT